MLVRPDASRQWRESVIVDLREELSRTIRKRNRRPGDDGSVVEETLMALTLELDRIWHGIAVDAVQARRIRVAKLTAADLGILGRFRSFTGWALRERVRSTLEGVLRTEGWSKECLADYFVSHALDVRSRQLAGVVGRVTGNRE